MRSAEVMYTPFVSGRLDAAVPPDILERIARRVDEGRLVDTATGRSHAIAQEPDVDTDYRSARVSRSRLRLFRTGTHEIETLELVLDGDRLRFEARIGSARKTALVVAAVLAGLFTLLLAILALQKSYWLFAILPVAWFFAIALGSGAIEDARKRTTQLVAKIVEEEMHDARLEARVREEVRREMAIEAEPSDVRRQRKS